ncbi:MAG: helix-turn-helix transcriptional regulator [Microgenomates group bacterium]
MKKSKINSKNWYSLDDLIRDQLKDPEFRRLWEEGEADYQLGRQIIQARIDKKISQRVLAKRAHTTQAVISRIESQDVSTTLQMATRIARALGKTLQISFV